MPTSARCPNCEAEQIRAIEAERDRLRERERFFAKALDVADGGQYRNDWPGAIERLIGDRDRLAGKVARVEAELNAWRPSGTSPGGAWWRRLRAALADGGE